MERRLNMRRALTLIELLMVIAIPTLGTSSLSAQDVFADDSTIKTFLHDNFDGKNVGMVIGLVDERGGRVFSAGGMDNGTKQTVDGDTVFEIGSVTKTFTTLLLQDSAGRGEVKLEDSISDYLPKSVRCPTYGGKEITLLQLATHTSGLPEFPNNLSPGDGNRAYSGYTVEQLYDFLSGFTLTCEPGRQWEYSNVGMALLAHILVLKTGTDYESLVTERICRPLKMESTRITLTDEMKSRFARGHDSSGAPLPGQKFSVMNGASGLRSTANDLLKYISANLDLNHSSLTPLMKLTQAPRSSAPPKHNLTAMDWVDHGDVQPPGMKLLGHGGLTTGYTAFIAIDLNRNRGVVVLFNQRTDYSRRLNTGPGGLGPDSVGWLILEGGRLTPQTASVLFAGNSEELVGIGVRLDFDAATHALVMSKVFPDSPASRVGLPPGLIVQKVDGVSTAGKTMAECLGLIRGKAGTKVRLELMNPKRNETNTVELMRQKFTPPKQ
jgi:D-alanyl-D-alanine-carboxypeptidase/D-alanyl-D-alanine-endopeptidase